MMWELFGKFLDSTLGRILTLLAQLTIYLVAVIELTNGIQVQDVLLLLAALLLVFSVIYRRRNPKRTL
jgi:hypothetical protein